MKKKFASLLVLVMSLAVAFTALVACKDKENTPENKNETVPLVIQSSELDGVFNPFFYSSAYDGDVLGLVSTSLLTTDPNGAIVAGDEYATVAKSYSIDPKPDGTAEYEIVLKNGLKFSDGSAITADDVLFNYYVYLDPKYDGSSTLYTLPIKGLAGYRYQLDPDLADKYVQIANKIYEIGFIENYLVTSEDLENGITQELYDAYWEYIDEAGLKFTQEIFDYVNTAYAKDTYVKGYFHPELDYATISANEGYKVAYAMSIWGFGDPIFSYEEAADGKYVNLPQTDDKGGLLTNRL